MQDLSVPPSNTVFVWEFARHGARAPLLENESSDFSVPVENLTPQGMRQRYLLGRYLNERVNRPFGYNHTEYADFVENKYTDVYVQSTGYARTIQSGYAELLGFTNVTKKNQLDYDLYLSEK